MAFAQTPQVLPKAEQPFGDAKIGRTYKESKPGTITLTKTPDGAPNVLMILIDDSGFGQWGTFGGQVPTPNPEEVLANSSRRARSVHAAGASLSVNRRGRLKETHGRTH